MFNFFWFPVQLAAAILLVTMVTGVTGALMAFLEMCATNAHMVTMVTQELRTADLASVTDRAQGHRCVIQSPVNASVSLG